MQALYTLFNPEDPLDITVFYKHENAKLVCDSYNETWTDPEGAVQVPKMVYNLGVETFRDEEWPIVLRVLHLLKVTVESEEEDMQVFKLAAEAHKKAQEAQAEDQAKGRPPSQPVD